MFEEAVGEYKITISLNNRHQLAYYNLGYIYFNNLKQSQEGVKMLQKCLEIDPTDVDAQINMALAFNDLGMIDDVIKSYKYIIEHNEKSVMAHFNLGLFMFTFMFVRIEKSISQPCYFIYIIVFYLFNNVYMNDTNNIFLFMAILHV